MREQNAMEKRQPLLISDAGETGQLQGKNENIFSHHMQQREKPHTGATARENP